ncbi:MAG TPA: hypothetical protein ENK18_28030 [Deltaproteobacteria bacterium]|nr:hypothetical protein [Deltaproteobacteria bacterium]
MASHDTTRRSRDRLEGWTAWVTGNLWSKLLALVLALAAWLYVQGEQVHEQTMKATVQWKLPPKLVTTEPLPTSLALVVRGTRTATRSAEHMVARLPVDISEIGVGEHGLEFDAFPMTGLPPSLQVVSIKPSSLRFTLDELAVTKVKVRPVLVGDPGDGFEIQESTVDPPVIEVRGPRSKVASLREVSTRSIDVSGLVSDTISDVDLDLPRGVELASEVVPTASIVVVPTSERRVLTQVPVLVWGRYDFQPEEAHVDVTLEGPAGQLEGVTFDRVVAMVHVPEPAVEDRYEAWFGPQEGVRMRILHPGGEDVEVVAVQPPQVTVVRR